MKAIVGHRFLKSSYVLWPGLFPVWRLCNYRYLLWPWKVTTSKFK